MTKTKRCKTTGNKSLRQLLTQFLTIFENYKRIDSYILEDTLGKVCRKLGYKMDCFPGCQEAGLPEEFLRNNCDEARFAQLVKTLDEEMLDSLLYSQRRYVTRWSYSEDFTPQLVFFQGNFAGAD